MNKDNIIKYSIISVFVSLYFLVATISMIHSIKFFGLSNSEAMSITLSIAFELGQVAALCGILILDKTNKGVVWALFLLLTSMQIMSNVYFAYVNLGDYKAWSELFGLAEEDPIFQKRILSIISGGILPVVALGFIKSLVDYLKPQATESQSVEAKSEILMTTVNAESEQPDEVETVSEKLNLSLDIESELEEPVTEDIQIETPVETQIEKVIEQQVEDSVEKVKQIITKKVDVQRTPGQYIDPIVGGGSIKARPKK